jgi:hypothetical protein
MAKKEEIEEFDDEEAEFDEEIDDLELDETL